MRLLTMPARLFAICGLIYLSSASALAQPETDHDPLALRGPHKEHTILVPIDRGGGEGDRMARDAARKLVDRVLAEPPGELWARATDAQVTALREKGFWPAYRDGV